MKDRVKRTPARLPQRARPLLGDAARDQREVPTREKLAVRPAQRADIDAITALDAKITGLAKPAHWTDLYRRQIQELDAAGGVVFLIATPVDEPEQLLGFIVGEIRAWEFGSDPCGWVYALTVEPDARLRGVAEALLAAVAKQFRKAGMSKMRTMVARDDRLPMLFFRSEGMMAGPYIQLEKDLE